LASQCGKKDDVFIRQTSTHECLTMTFVHFLSTKNMRIDDYYTYFGLLPCMLLWRIKGKDLLIPETRASQIFSPLR